ncbi:MAG: Mur ligase family protein [Treponema sp.]|nr:Mur ligase family protein [Treponema sp.]
MVTSSEVYEWILSFIKFGRDRSQRSAAIDRMRILADFAGHPEKCAPSIHVAGSKGKGSVTGMIASILDAHGIKTARYASPNVSDFRERVSLGSRFFDEETYCSAGMDLKQIIEGRLHEMEEPAFFELFTLWFFLCSRHANCGAMAVETGMGGRLDATNILDPVLSVITIIELEHTEYLGDTIAAIAGEKAGIIKNDRPLILAEQKGEALAVFKEHAQKKNSPLIYFPEHAETGNIDIDRRGTSFSLSIRNPKGGVSILNDLFIPIPGEVQAKNAALSILASKTAFPEIGESSIREGLSNFTLPARFECISQNPLFIIDGAHTPESIDLCLKTFSSLYGSEGILIFGCAAKKDIASMAALCMPFFSRIIITRPGTFKHSNPEEILTIFEQEGRKLSKPPTIYCIPDTDEAVENAVNLALEHGLPILGAGSFYLAGEIRGKIAPM